MHTLSSPFLIEIIVVNLLQGSRLLIVNILDLSGRLSGTEQINQDTMAREGILTSSNLDRNHSSQTR